MATPQYSMFVSSIFNMDGSMEKIIMSSTNRMYIKLGDAFSNK